MGSTNITNHLIYPTQNDINGGVPFAGRRMYETTMVDLERNPGGLPGYVISGWTLPSSGSNTQTLTGGTAVIDGYLIKGTGTYAFTFDNSSTDHIFLQLVYTSGLVTGLQVVANTASAPLPNAIKLGTVTTGASTVSSSKDMRPGNRRLYGAVTSSATVSDQGSGFWTVASGGTGVYVFTWTTGLFLRAPTVTGAICGAAGQLTSELPNVGSATSSTVTTRNSSGTATALDFVFQAFL
jgi:hypothetical protein